VHQLSQRALERTLEGQVVARCQRGVGGSFGQGPMIAQVQQRRDEVVAQPVGGSSRPHAGGRRYDRERLQAIPYIALDPKETPTTRAATVAFTTSTYGINTAGTVYRMDDVPIPLRPAFESPYPSDEVVLKAIEKRGRQLQGVSC